MSVSAFTAAMLLAGGPLPAETPALQSDDIAATPGAPAPFTSSFDGTGGAPAHAIATDPNEIVVRARVHSAADPLEPANAKSFAITQSVDEAFVGPVAMTYQSAVPQPVRDGVRNFLNNLQEPVVFLNFLIQFNPAKAGETLGRFAINTTAGGAGLFDVAKRQPFNLPRRPNGLADSLGFYGVKPGAFLFLPLVGPTTVRDAIGGVVDRLIIPLSLGSPFNRPIYALSAGTLSALGRRADFDKELNRIRDEEPDPYTARRELYLRKRQAEIDGLRAMRHPASDARQD